MDIEFKHARLIQKLDLDDEIIQSFEVNSETYGIMLYNKDTKNRNFAYFCNMQDMFAYFNLLSRPCICR